MPDPDEPEPESPSFGEELKKEREIRGISLAEIADATKISKRFLDALERNDFAILPAPVFTRGFVREYARYLGLNAEEMLTRYGHFASTHREGDDPQPLISSSFSGSVRTKRRSGWWIWLLGGFLLALAVALGLWFFKWGRSESKASEIPPSFIGQPLASPSIQALETVETAPAEPILTLELTAKERTWVELHADERLIVRAELKEGEIRRLTAREQFEFKTIGNARGLTLRLNGVTLPPLGESGQVVHGQILDRRFLRTLPTSTDSDP